MSVGEFCDFLSTKFDDDVIASFRSSKISNANFTKLSEQQLEKLVTAVSDVMKLQMFITREGEDDGSIIPTSKLKQHTELYFLATYIVHGHQAQMTDLNVFCRISTPVLSKQCSVLVPSSKVLETGITLL